MTDVQLYLSLGIPALLITLNLTVMLYLFNTVHSRMDRFENKLDATRLELTARIDRVADATATFYGDWTHTRKRSRHSGPKGSKSRHRVSGW